MQLFNLQIFEIFSVGLAVYAAMLSTYVFYVLWRGKRVLERNMSAHFSNLAKKSAQKRQQIAFTSRAIEDIVTQKNPVLAMTIKELFPGAYRWLAKNPQALPAIMQMLGNLGNGGNTEAGLETSVPTAGGSLAPLLKSFEKELKKEV